MARQSEPAGEDVDIEGLEDYFTEADVSFAILFGSHARGTADGSSDVDIAVRFPEHVDETFSTGSSQSAVTGWEWSISVPSTSRNAASHSGWSGQAWAVTRLPSVATPSAQVPPAARTSASSAG